MDIVNYLISIKDDKYKEFNLKIINTKYEILGIKMPILRKIAKQIKDYQNFLNLDNYYYEVVLIKGFIISNLEFEELIKYLDDYLLLIDNWAICDSFGNSLKIVKKYKSYFYDYLNKLIKTKEEYKVRLGLVLLLNYYVEEEYLDSIFKIVDNLKSDYYYVNMASAWLLCECFTKYPKETLKYLDSNHLDKFVINMTIRKIRDSYKINKEMKDYILKYKR